MCLSAVSGIMDVRELDLEREDMKKYLVYIRRDRYPYDDDDLNTL